MTLQSPLSASTHRRFVERLLIAAALGVLFLLLWTMRDLVMVVFGAIVTAVLLNVLAEPVARAARLGRRTALALVIGGALVLTGALAAFFGRQIGLQFDELSSSLPQGWEDLRRLLGAYPIGRQLLLAVDAADGAGVAILSRMSGVLLAVGNALLDLVLILVGGVFFAARPFEYRDGLLKLFPADWRGLLGEALDDSGRALRLWLRGQLISIVIVGTLTWAGLALAGVPAAFALGAVAAGLEIVPYIGPIVSAIPGLLLALALAPETALWALFVYIGVQQLEGDILQPLVQKRVVTLPPAVTLFAMVGAGLLFGFLGILLAAPASVVAYVLLKRLYVREVLHTATSVPGEPRPGEAD